MRIAIDRMARMDRVPVHRLYAACHPGWPALPPSHFFAYPTVVAVDTESWGEIVGYATFSLNVSDAGDLAVLLQDSGVAPKARGRGIAKLLMQARLDIGREMGAKCAVGMTQPENVEMLRILRGAGFEELRTILGAYPQFDPPRDGVLFVYDLVKDR